MKTLALGARLVGYTLLVVLLAPIAWWLRQPEDHDPEYFSEYDDDDLGVDVDEGDDV